MGSEGNDVRRRMEQQHASPLMDLVATERPARTVPRAPRQMDLVVSGQRLLMVPTGPLRMDLADHAQQAQTAVTERHLMVLAGRGPQILMAQQHAALRMGSAASAVRSTNLGQLWCASAQSPKSQRPSG